MIINNLINKPLSQKRAFATVFLVALLFRLIIGFPSLIVPDTALMTDSFGYKLLAESILRGEFPSVFRTPVYPLFVALSSTVFSSSVLPTIVLQMLLDSLTAAILFLLTRKIFGSFSIALLAGLLYGLSPVSAAISSKLMSESLYVFFTVTAIYILTYRNSYPMAAAQAGMWALASLTRPSGVFFPLSGYLLAGHFKDKISLWKKQTLVLVLYGLIICSWMGFNYYRSGRLFFVTVADVTVYKFELSSVQMLEDVSLPTYARLWIFNPPEAERIRNEYEVKFFREFYEKDLTEEERWQFGENPATAKLIHSEARKKLDGKLLSVLTIHLVGAFQILRPIPPWASIGVTATVIDLLRIVLFLTSILILLWKRNLSVWTAVFLGFWAVYAFYLPGIVGVWRFRAVAEPMISITIALALTAIWRHKIRQGQNP